MSKKLFLFTILSVLVASITVAQANEINFSDVTEDSEFKDDIYDLVEKGCVSGYQNNTFQPDNQVQRVEAIKMLMNCIELPEIYTEKTIQVPKGSQVTVGNNTTTVSEDEEVKIKIPFSSEEYSDLEFSDIQQDAWYIESLKEAVIRGIIKGYDDGTIKPKNTVTKGELFTMLYRLSPEKLQEIKTEEPLANDIASGYWFYNGLQMALENDILETDSDKNVSPSKELSRAEISKHINSYIKWLELRTTPISNEEKEEINNEVSEQNTTEETSNQTPSETEDTNEEISDEIKTEGFEVGYKEKGVASYYGFSFDGRRTASGTLLDTASYMAAHKYLPFGSIVRITDPETTKWVEVSIVDRGPFVEGRIIDLTPQAFEDLGFPLSKGIANVELEVISLPNN